MDSAGNLYGATAYQDGLNFIGGGQVFRSTHQETRRSCTPSNSAAPTATPHLTISLSPLARALRHHIGRWLNSTSAPVQAAAPSSRSMPAAFSPRSIPSKAPLPTRPLQTVRSPAILPETCTARATLEGQITWDLSLSWILPATLPSSTASPVEAMASPRAAGLYVSGDGTVYGTARQGDNGCGLAFKITP